MLKRSIVTAGWDKLVTVFRQSALTQYHVEPADWKGGKEHQDDILSAAFLPPTLLATGLHPCDFMSCLLPWQSGERI